MTPQPICNIVKILYEFCVEEFTSAEEGSDKEMAFMKMLDLFPQTVHSRTGEYPDYCSRSHQDPSSTKAPEFTSHNPCNAQPNTYRCCEVCPNVLSKPIFRVNCLQPQHDTAIRNATLDEVKQYADTCIWIDDDCCPGKMNDGDGSDCDGCSYVDYPNNADICEKIESLRSTSIKECEP